MQGFEIVVAMVWQDRDVLQLSIGRLVRELKEALLDRVNAPQSFARPSLYLYSGHDDTIMPLSGTRHCSQIDLNLTGFPLVQFRLFFEKHMQCSPLA